MIEIKDLFDLEKTIAAELFAGNLQGAKLMSNARHLRGSAWLNFTRVKCDQWWLKNENGARFDTPFVSTLDTHAMGRGMIASRSTK